MSKAQIFESGDEEIYASLICPDCGLFGTIDKEQYEGVVSIDCPGCDFHKTIDFTLGKEDEKL